MNVLLDTHVILWSLYEPDRLTSKARDIISNPDNWIYYSQISLWECEIKHNKHPDVFCFNASDVGNDCFNSGFSQLDLQSRHILSLGRIGEPVGVKHNDPFDRMLMSQAYSDNMLFLTHDKRLQNYNISNVVFV